MDFDPDTYDMAEMQGGEEAVDHPIGFRDNGVLRSVPEEVGIAATSNGVFTEPDPSQWNDHRHHETNGAVPAESDAPLTSTALVSSSTIPSTTDASLSSREPSENGHVLLPTADHGESSLTERETVGSSVDAEASLDVVSEGKDGEKQRPWWSDIIRRRHDGDRDTEERDVVQETKRKALPSKKERVRWWMWLTSSITFWKSRSQIISSRSSSKGKGKSRHPPPDRSVVVPEDLPLEEIAKEVVRLKTVNDKDEEERMNRVYAEALERSDRKWIMLLCFLIAISIGMLSVVAFRIGPQ